MTDKPGNHQRKVQIGKDWYEIELEGYLNPGWFDWLDGWEIISLPNGNTLLSGRLIDQPALHGLFAYIRDLNFKIISLQIRAPQQSSETQAMEK